MSNLEKISFVEQLLLVVQETPYDPEYCANLALVRSLDYQAYRFGDSRLNEIIDLLQGMTAGEEFIYPQSEVIEMLSSYLRELKV